ncbi:unnamed protein product [Sphenostylis stenocarpa]|uniref:Uncharacterized protein n=1 Tax=Sphenostylis stenocarpa TaxID=92480 RepID=A0AA86W1U2_9FABA|nr:unnamed protein product [Sphenostylis stenocarpa]
MGVKGDNNPIEKNAVHEAYEVYKYLTVPGFCGAFVRPKQRYSIPPSTQSHTWQQHHPLTISARDCIFTFLGKGLYVVKAQHIKSSILKGLFAILPANKHCDTASKDVEPGSMLLR